MQNSAMHCTTNACKESYEPPALEISWFNTSDVVTESGGNDGEWDTDN